MRTFILFLTLIIYCLAILCCCSTPQLAPPSSIFKVHPYLVYGEKGNIFLKFQLNKKAVLIINKKAQTYQNDKLHTVKIGKKECDKKLEISILHLQEDGPDVIRFKRTLSPFSCDTAKEFVFAFISDTHGHAAHHEMLAQHLETYLKKYPIQFILNAGDVIEKGGIREEWQKFINKGHEHLSKVPVIAALGNHAYHKGDKKTPYSGVPKYFKEFLRVPGDSSAGFLVFQFPQFKLLVLNSNVVRLSDKDQSDQWRWVKRELKKAFKSKLPVVVACHHFTYSSNSFRMGQLDAQILREKLVPLLEKYQVPLMLAGHAHLYERSYKKGVNYINSGPSGAYAMFSLWGNDYKILSDSWEKTFTIVRMGRNFIKIEVIDSNGDIIDKESFPLN